MKPTRNVCVVGAACLLVACSDGTGPSDMTRFEGQVSAVPADATPVQIVGTAYSDNNCDGGAVLARSETTAQSNGAYSFDLHLADGVVACVRAEAETMNGYGQRLGGAVARSGVQKSPEPEGPPVLMGTILIKIMISRPGQ